MKELFKKEWFGKFLIPVLLVIPFLFITVSSIEGKTATSDENKHLIRGIMLLETGDFRLNQHHPFLFNVINSLPTLLDQDLVLVDTEDDRWTYSNKDGLGNALTRDNGGAISFAENVLYIPRLTQIAFSALFILLFYTLLRGEFGTSTATIAATMLTFNTTFIAHARLVTTDAPATMVIFLASFFLYRYIRYGFKTKHFVWFIFLSTIALLTKFTATLVAPFWLATILIAYFVKAKGKFLPRIWPALKPVLIVLISWLMLMTASHGFQFNTLKEMDYGNVDKIEDMTNHLRNMSKRMGLPQLGDSFVWIYEEVQFPFPQYVRGFYSNVFKHNYYGHGSYLLGEFSNGGQWYYFPTAFLTKESIGFTMLLSLSLGLYISKVVKEKRMVGGILAPLFIAAVILTLLSMKSQLNLGVRHLMPIYPFLFVAIGIVLSGAWNNKWIKGITVTMLIAVIAAPLYAFPDYISYFNLAVGGGENGYLYVRDSNLDWGQNSGFVEIYIRDNPGTTEDISDIKYNERFIIDVEDLFGNPEKANSTILGIKEQIENGEVEPIEILHNTHWIFEVEDLDL